MKMQVAEVVVKIMEKEGITDSFGIPGAGINPVYKYMGLSSIKHYTMRHEEAAVHAADGFYRASGKMAAALCTSGPGATNFVTGIYTANIDSIPLLAITGQAVTAQLDKDPFQCVDIAKICEPVAKKTYCVTKAEDIVPVMTEAFSLARGGKPGPVLIDLPLDIQQAEVEFDPDTYVPVTLAAPAAKDEEVAKAIDMIANAKAPVIIMGGGVILSHAEQALVQFAEEYNIPVITTYMAKGGIPVNHPLNAGHAGIQVGQPLGNRVLQDSDVVLGIGCRFTDRHTGAIAAYRGNRKFIHVNIEPKEIGKVFPADIGIVSDAAIAIEKLTAAAKAKGLTKFADRGIAALRTELKRKTDYDCTPIKPQRVYQEMNNVFDDDTLFTTGCGLTQIWSGQLQDINKPRHYLPSGGAGTLGFDIPALIGAKVAQPDKTAVAVMGDFGFTFLVEEFAVAAAYHLPIIVVIVNNAYLGLIRQNQNYAYNYEYAVEMKVNQSMMDYVKVAQGFGGDGERVFKPEDIAPAMERAKKSKVPYIIDIVCEEKTDCSMGGAIDNIREFI